MFRTSLAAAAALAAMPASVNAADWQLAGLAIGSGNRGVTYVDVSSLRQIRGKIRFRSEQHFQLAEKGMDRIVAVSEIDCDRMTVTTLRAQYFLKNGLIAMVNIPREDNAYSSTGSLHWVTRRVCGGDYLSGPILDRNADARRMFALDWAPFAQQMAIAIPRSHPRTQVASMSTSNSGKAPRR